MKNIVIFGATGNTGLCVVNFALKKKLNVSVFVRDKKKLPADIKSKVEIIVGDVRNYEDVLKAVSGKDAVTVALGTRNDLSPTTVLSHGMKNIVEAMKANNVDIVSVCLSAFLFYKVEAVPAVFKDLNEDHQRMFHILKSSDLKWIAVFPPHIADTPSSMYVVKHDQSPGRAISKHDLAAFLVDSLEQPEHYNQVCGIATTD